MTWTDFDERYGESKEDHTAVEEDDRDRCSICGMLHSPADLTERTVMIRRRRVIEQVCPDCLAAEEEIGG